MSDLNLLPLKPQQEAALEQLKLWWQKIQDTDMCLDPFILQGYAGVGKTTILKHVLAMLDASRPALIAPTNKAARVLSVKTGVETSTVHKLLYRPVDDERNEIRKRLAELLETPDDPEVEILENRLKELAASEVKFSRKDDIDLPGVILGDEWSMVSMPIGSDVENLMVPLICSGDPFQLQPVRAKAWWEGRRPDVVLTEIVRQTGDGAGIAIAANRIREGMRPTPGMGFEMAPRGSLGWNEYLDYDIILCGTNNLRRTMNHGIRRKKGYGSAIPEVGEKLISLSNSEIFGLTNGETYTVASIFDQRGRVLTLDLVDDFGIERQHVHCWVPLFEDDSQTNMVPHGLAQLTYAYAITVHKSQGSEWKRVCVLDDWRGSDKDRWLYTGITRAADFCTYVGDM